MNKTKILIVEDEPIGALDIKNTILKLGYTVTDIVSNYDDALSSIRYNQPSIIFMDINLENSKSGIEIAEQLPKDIQVIYLTAYSDEETINAAVKTNPIGYLHKPFNREEIKSIIFLALYKMKDINNPIIDSTYTELTHGYYYDLKNDNLFYQEQPINISFKEKKLLKILIEANGGIVPFSEAESYIWGGASISDSACRTVLYRLRSRFEFDLINTIPTFGYQLKLNH